MLLYAFEGAQRSSLQHSGGVCWEEQVNREHEVGFAHDLNMKVDAGFLRQCTGSYEQHAQK